MGRPRKRMREDRADDTAVALADVNENDIGVHDFSVFGDFGTITPPQLLDSNCYVFNNTNTTASTPHQHLRNTDVFGPSPDLNSKCAFYRSYCHLHADHF
jgi:hypothetical protein